MFRFGLHVMRATVRHGLRWTPSYTSRGFYSLGSFATPGLFGAADESKNAVDQATTTEAAAAAARAQTPLDAQRVVPPHFTRTLNADRATSAEVWEMQQGIFASLVPDKLGYHAPLSLREVPLPTITTASHPAENCSDESDRTKTPLRATTTGTVNCADRDRDVRHRSRSADNQGAGGKLTSFTFYGPLAAFEVSPVFEWLGCLWQWRPVEVRHVRHLHRVSRSMARPHGYSGTEMWEGEEDEGRNSEGRADQFETGNGRARRDPSNTQSNQNPADAHFYLVPFVLLPSNEVASGRPRLDATLRDLLLTRHTAQHYNDNAQRSRQPRRTARDVLLDELEQQASSSATLFLLTAPTPVGDLALDVTPTTTTATPTARRRAVSVFTLMEHRLAQERTTAVAAVAPLLPPAAETWEAATTDLRGAAAALHRSTPRESVLATVTAPYIRVYRSDTDAVDHDDGACGADVAAHPEKGGACASSVCGEAAVDVAATRTKKKDAARGREAIPRATPPPPHQRLPATRQNVMGGGLAELLLAIDRYAALLARGELTLSAACWATLCDTKAWWVVQQLRLSPRAVERELVAAAAAHRRWHQRALARNQTLVGKSSHGVRFDDYPHLARWVGH